MNIGVVGLGLIGASLAKSIKKIQATQFLGLIKIKARLILPCSETPLTAS